MLMRMILGCVSFSIILAAATAGRAREISVTFQAPATNYSVQIQHAWLVGDEVWVVSQVGGGGGIGGAAITRVSDSVEVEAADDAAVRHFVIGRTWNWWDGDDATFAESVDALREQMETDGDEIDAVLFEAE